jgi:hypothetical protein
VLTPAEVDPPPRPQADPEPPSGAGPAGSDPEQASAAGSGRFEECPFCGADVPDPGNLACVDCLRPFPAPTGPPDPPEQRRDDGPLAGTRRDAVTGVRLRLTFSAHGEALGEVEVRPEEELLVGREPASRCAEILGARENVSRRHAVVGLEGDGAAWVRDEYSMNGTRVNDVPVRPGRQSVLEHGDRLAFGADVVAAVVREGSR